MLFRPSSADEDDYDSPDAYDSDDDFVTRVKSVAVTEPSRFETTVLSDGSLAEAEATTAAPSVGGNRNPLLRQLKANYTDRLASEQLTVPR